MPAVSRPVKEIDQLAFVKIVREKAKLLGINDEMLKRAVNVGFSGGERSVTKFCRWPFSSRRWRFSTRPTPASMSTRFGSCPKVNLLRDLAERARHYALSAALNHIIPDYVHILAGGKVRKSGGKELALEVEIRICWDR